MQHLSITAEMNMADLIHLNPQLLPVINRFGIRLGFGDKSIDEVCQGNSVDTDFFLEIVNTFNDEKYFPVKQLQTFDARMIIGYLQTTHHYYQEIKVPEIRDLIKQLLEATRPEHKNTVELLQAFFSEYVSELNQHLQLEETRTFPYVLALQRSIETAGHETDIVTDSHSYNMFQFVEEHSDLEDKLLDLKNILIKYIPSPLNSNLCNKILEALFQLENDIRDHARIEDKVLVPKVKMMEKKIASLRRRTGPVNPYKL